MKNYINCLIDTFIVVAVTFISLFLIHFLVGWLIPFSPSSFVFGRIFTFIYSMVITDVLPHILLGLFQGTVTALFVRTRRLTVTMLPSMLFFLFSVIFFSLNSTASNLKGFLWLTAFNVISWTALIISAFLSARWVLKRRAK